jgi:hypothetical protein
MIFVKVLWPVPVPAANIFSYHEVQFFPSLRRVPRNMLIERLVVKREGNTFVRGVVVDENGIKCNIFCLPHIIMTTIIFSFTGKSTKQMWTWVRQDCDMVQGALGKAHLPT